MFSYTICFCLLGIYLFMLYQIIACIVFTSSDGTVNKHTYTYTAHHIGMYYLCPSYESYTRII